MTNVIADRIKNIQLTKAQKKIADYFIRNPERIGISSSMEIANRIGVSDVSITRFARAIGYEGFTDLKNDVYNGLAKDATKGANTLSLAERYDFNQCTLGAATSAKDYLDVIKYNAERSFLQNDDEIFNKVVSMIIKSKHRYVCGFRGCLGIANQFSWLMRLLIDHVILIVGEGPGGIGMLQDIGPKDCFIMFSVSRYYKSDITLLRLAKEKGAKICLITDSVVSPMAELSDFILTAETKQMGFFHSTVAITMISEYLVTRVTQELPEEYHKRAEERDALTAELRVL